MKGRVLIIAGSDSGGGAGIQADIKTVTALGGYAMTAITALTAQNTEGVFGIHEVPAPFVAQQIQLVLSDIGADCVKVGMLHSPEIIDTVAAELRRFKVGGGGSARVVVDPVMVAKGGHSLLAADAVSGLKDRMLPLADVLTPNIPEAEALANMPIRGTEDAAEAGRRLAVLGAKTVLLKGGHLTGDTITDVLLQDGAVLETFANERIDTPHTHGTGCTLASAIATGLAQGMTVVDAVRRARAYVLEAIRTAPGFGHGHGPLNHAHTVRDFS